MNAHNEGLDWNKTEDSTGTQQHMQNLYMKQHTTFGTVDTHQHDCEGESQKLGQKGWD